MRSMKEIAETVGELHELKQHEMWNERRCKEYVHARHHAFYEMMSEGHGSYKIGAFWKRNHVTVMHGAAQHAKRHNLPSVTNYGLEKQLEGKRVRALEAYRRQKAASK